MSKKREERKRKRLEGESKEKYKKFSKVFYLNKKVGETPLELLEKFQKSFKFKLWQKKQNIICQKRKVKRKGCQKISLAYAGRLDPMAEGKMLILAGEACKEREKYLSLDKEYIFEILLGFSSDTGDILGLVKGEVDRPKNFLKIKNNLKKILTEMKGKKNMKYPHYSSKAVNGKPLFLWSLEGRIGEIEIPEKEIEIYKIDLLKFRKIKISKIRKEVFKKIGKLKKVEEESKKMGEDFRRQKVLKSWDKSLNNFQENDEVLILKIKTKVSSGTYMRVLAEEIAEKLGTKGLAYSIKRSSIF